MKKIVTALFIVACAGYVQAQTLSQPPSGNNQKAKVIQNIGPVEVSIAYSSPHVHTAQNDRTDHIWGELVHYGYIDQGFGTAKPAPYRPGPNKTPVIKFP